MNEEEIMKIIVEEAIHIHRKLGPGLLENVYKQCLAYRLRKRGLFVETEKPIPVFFEEVRMECGYRADLVVENKVVIDTKTIDFIGDLEIAQILTHLEFIDLRYGLILNFKVTLMKNGIKRVLRGYAKISSG
ncbi:MAG TPA: GxxExxY protein [Chitinophagaceae bacterium]|nr:GxxExxY protein [Chitinophagaceae bacterium]